MRISDWSSDVCSSDLRPVPTLERMARLGVLGRWIPAFAQVSGRMQFDLFHVYTVDQHTLAVLRNLASFGQAAPEDDRFATAREAWPTLSKPELLLLAGLFHDIDTVRGGDHSEVGAEAEKAFGAASSEASRVGKGGGRPWRFRGSQ